MLNHWSKIHHTRTGKYLKSQTSVQKIVLGKETKQVFATLSLVYQPWVSHANSVDFHYMIQQQTCSLSICSDREAWCPWLHLTAAACVVHSSKFLHLSPWMHCKHPKHCPQAEAHSLQCQSAHCEMWSSWVRWCDWKSIHEPPVGSYTSEWFTSYFVSSSPSYSLHHVCIEAEHSQQTNYCDLLHLYWPSACNEDHSSVWQMWH